MANTIDSSLYLSSLQQQSSSSTSSSSTLGQDAFLKLLITQLQNQDPLNPMDDSEYISQMATFSELEQMISMNESITDLVSLQQDQQLLLYNQLLGKEVDWTKTVESEESEETSVETGKGTITSIDFSSGTAIFQLEDGSEISIENITSLASMTSENDIVSASYLIGKQVSWEVDGETKTGLVQSVSSKDGQLYFNLNDEEQTKLTMDQIQSIEMI